jgi:hypothetical protein
VNRASAVALAAAAALAVLAGIAVTGSPGQPSSSPPRADRAPALPGITPSRAAAPAVLATGLPGLHWVTVRGYRLPVSAQAGPRDTSGGLASGFADSPAGALLAAINIASRTAWEFGPGIFQPTIEFQVTGPYASQMLSADLDAWGADQATLPGIAEYAQCVAYQWAGYTPSDATADLVVTAPGTSIYVASQIQVQWINGDWRVLAPPGGDWDNSSVQIPSLNGYLTIPGQEG